MGRQQLAGCALILVVTALAGCALPGFDSGAMEGDHWYNFGSHHETTYQDKLSKEHVTDYKPRVVDITPSLIRHQKVEREHETLDPDVKKLTQQPRKINYEVGSGDVLQVIVFGHPELTNPSGITNSNGNDVRGQLVSSDGDIYYPYVGQIHVAGLTLEQVRHKLAHGLSGYIRDPQVDVRVREYRSQRVYISGDIAKPCTVPINDISLTIVQALDACNSLQSKEGGSTGVRNVVLIRNGQSTLVNLNKVYAAGNEIPLKPDDRLLVDDTANRVFMVGEFDEQKALPYTTGGMSISDAIADAGGVDLGTANTSAIYVIRGFISGRHASDGGVKTVMRPNVYKLDMSNPGGLLLANQFELQPRDVVFAAPASFVNLNRALAVITPSLDKIFKGLYLYDRFGRH